MVFTLLPKTTIQLSKRGTVETIESMYDSDEELPEEISILEASKEIDDNAAFRPSSYRNDDLYADSPYFDAFVNKEMHTVEVVEDTMKDIVAQTEDFVLSGMRMASSTRQLACSCKLDPLGDSSPEELKSKQKALDPDVVNGLERLGDALDEIASAQEHFCRFINMFLLSKMQSLAETKIKQVHKEAQKETNDAEQLLTKYLRGGADSWGQDNATKQLPRRRSSREELICDPQALKAMQVARWKHDLVKIRTSQTSAELKRYQLITRILDSKYKQNVGIATCADQLASQMCSYFSKCVDLVTGLSKATKVVKAKCVESQWNHQKKLVGGREDLLKDSLLLAMQMEANAKHEVKKVSDTPELSSPDPSRCEFNLEEEYAQIWDLPSTLASCSGLSRPKAKGVLAEGWLYRQTASRYRGTASWNRVWFLVRKDGIFTFESNAAECTRANDFFIEKIKICDLQLCTIRDVPEIDDDPSTRFCFELITPSNYSERLILQARGPHNLQMWLNAIRLGTSLQIAGGIKVKKYCDDDISDDHVPCQKRCSSIMERFSLLSLSSRNLKPQRTSSEIRATILERGESLFGADVVTMDESTANYDLSRDVEELMEANPTCADCGEGCPDWVSLNLGILVCLECSGVHRSLGVHVSKVRSLTLDALTDEESRLLLSLGNDRVNQLWEKEVPDDVFERRKVDREDWIRRKYIQKEFVGTDVSSSESEVDACQNLFEASKRGDLIGVAKAIVYGGKVNWKNPKEANKTALDVCGVDVVNHEIDAKTDECKELLMQNGGEVKGSGRPDTPKTFLFQQSKHRIEEYDDTETLDDTDRLDSSDGFAN